jgi:hypothetical protein
MKTTKPDPAIVKAICDNLEIGMPIALAAEAEGVSNDTVLRWVEAFPDFAQQIAFARARGVKNLVIRPLAGGEGCEEAWAMLELLCPEFYGPPEEENASAKTSRARSVG